MWNRKKKIMNMPSNIMHTRNRVKEKIEKLKEKKNYESKEATKNDSRSVWKTSPNSNRFFFFQPHKSFCKYLCRSVRLFLPSFFIAFLSILLSNIRHKTFYILLHSTHATIDTWSTVSFCISRIYFIFTYRDVLRIVTFNQRLEIFGFVSTFVRDHIFFVNFNCDRLEIFLRIIAVCCTKNGCNRLHSILLKWFHRKYLVQMHVISNMR